MAGTDFIKTYTTEPPIAGQATKVITGTDVGNKRALDAYIQGGNVAASSAGAVTGKTTATTIDENAWYPLPATPLTGRKGFSIQNLSGSDVLLNFSNTAALNEGITLANGNERFYDIQAIIYGVRKSGSGNIQIVVEELA